MITRSLPSDRRTTLSYVALGDSTVYGLGATSPSRHFVGRLFERIRHEYPNARLVNRGVCMATAADVLAQQVPDAILDRPHLVTLSVGPNDLRRGFTPQDFARRVEVILERLHRETEATVVVNRLPEMEFCPRFSKAERSLVGAMTRYYNHALQHVVDGFGIELIDIGVADRPEAERHRFFSADGYHPSDEGYAAWTDVVWGAVNRLIPNPPVERKRLVANIA